MPKAKKDYIHPSQLSREVVNLARGGIPPKRIYERFKHHTVEQDSSKGISLADVQEIIYNDIMENGF